MDSILTTIILPPSRNLLTLLDFCYAITLIIYLPFFAMTVGSLTLSVFYRLISGNNPARKEFAREILLQIFPEAYLFVNEDLLIRFFFEKDITSNGNFFFILLFKNNSLK